METKHTPGPWRAYESNDIGWFNIESELDRSDVVGCEGCANEADARLIAAAPELMEAIEELILWEPRQKDESERYAYQLAKAAIAKATGQTI